MLEPWGTVFTNVTQYTSAQSFIYLNKAICFE